MLRNPAAQLVGHGIDVVKERSNEGVKVLSCRRERERPPLKQGHAQEFLQLKDLPAHRWLLNPIRHVPHRLADTAVPGDIIEQLQVMNVHSAGMFPSLLPVWTASGNRHSLSSLDSN